jgi:Arc/MetJ-type ribon-helix-helix transcriptional regulator
MASRVVRARLDPPSQESLDLLMREGLNESEAVRSALVEAGRRRRQRSALAEEVRRIAADEGDRAERTRVMAEMESVGAEWPPA